MKPTRRGPVGTKPTHSPARAGEIGPADPYAATLPHELRGLPHETSAIGPDLLATVAAAVIAALIPRTPGPAGRGRTGAIRRYWAGTISLGRVVARRRLTGGLPRHRGSGHAVRPTGRRHQ